MSMSYRQAKLTTEELHEVKYLMGGALTLLSLWALASLDIDSGILLLASAVAVVFSLVRPVWVSRIPPKVWRFTGPFLVFIIGADFILSMPEFIPSLARMVVWLMLLRNFSPRRVREDLQLILLCLFCLVLSGVMTVSLLFAFQILLFTPMAMALLFVICLIDRGKHTVEQSVNWELFNWLRLVKRVWRVLDLRVLSLGALMFGFVVSVSSLLFTLMPRFNIDQAIPFLQMQTQAMTGFSEQVSLGDVSAVQNDNAVAVQIDVPSLDAFATRPYWRMLVLDRYVEGGFRMSKSLDGALFRKSSKRRELRTDDVPMSERRELLWTFYIEGGVSRYLPVPGDFAVLRFQMQQNVEILQEPRVYSIDAVPQSVFFYQIEDLQFNQRIPAGPQEREGLVSAIASGELEVPKYPSTLLELAISDDERKILAEVNEVLLQGRELSAAEYSKELTEELWRRFDYSLRPDGRAALQKSEGGPDPVINWLREGSRGHCELFASTFVLLAREAGYPARLIVGFAGGSWNSVEDYYVLRNRDAHAWVEIYDRSTKEWLRVDPTPGNGPSDPEVAVSHSVDFETGWGAWVDGLRIQWYRRIVNFEQEDQVEMAMSLKEMVDEFAKEFGSRAKKLVAEFKAWLERPFSAGNVLRGMVVVFFVLSLYLIWRMRYWVLGLVFRLLRRPKALDPVRLQSGRYLKRLEEKYGQGLPSGLKLELQRLRYGPELSFDLAKPTLRRARRALRTGDFSEAA